jgi:hypothetical protein
MTVGWIANRNALLTMTWTATAILFHHRYRSAGSKWAALAATLSVALALCSAESGISVFAYLGAYALFLDKSRLWRALVHLLPYVCVALIWRVLYKHGGYGTFASEVYLDPGAQPAMALRALFWNFPALLASQFSPSIPFADLMLWAPPSQRPVLLAFAWLTVLVMAALCYRPLRADPVCRFWGAGLLLSAAPLTTSAAGDRLLFPVSLGAAALTAHVIASLLTELKKHTAPTSARLISKLALAGLVLAHAVLAPLALPLRTRATALLGEAADRADRSIPAGASISDKTVIVANAPVDVVLSYIQLSRARRGTPRPKHLYWLATASSPFTLERTAASTLRLEKPAGLLASLTERHYRASWLPLARGAEVLLGEMRARVVDTTSDGKPRVVDFEFREPLDSERYVFLQWTGKALAPLELPGRAERRHFGTEDLFKVMFGTLLPEAASHP